MEFTYIIAYRHNEQRYKNLKTVLEWLKNFDCEIIIAEHDTIKHVDADVKHILLDNNLAFNKSWAFNTAYLNASADIIVFGDADLIMDVEQFKTALNELKNYDVVNPYNSVVDLYKEETTIFMYSGDFNTLKNISRSGRGETDHQKVPMCGGIIMFNRNALDIIGGWNEDFWGWGGEDDFMSIKVKHFLKYYENKAKCYHMYHDKAAIDYNLYMRNLEIYNKTKDLSKEQFKIYIDKIKNNIGKAK